MHKGDGFMRVNVRILAGLMVLAVAMTGIADEKGGKQVAPVLRFKMNNLAGKEVDLSKYQGKVILVVNVASQCGYTPQYEGLQMLHDKYSKDGLVVLGVPCNDFGAQEPGTSEEIAEFCKTNYGVKFDMLAKVSLKGKDQAPLYEYLTSKKTNPTFGGEISWNFTKFLIGRNGDIVSRFEPDVKPESDEVTTAIKTELSKK
jgi:glutathione peroxidase